MDFSDLNGFIFTCKEFKILFPEKMFKFVDQENRSKFGNHKYNLNKKNSDCKKFNSNCTCCEGGFYFTNKKNLKFFAIERHYDEYGDSVNNYFPYGNKLLEIQLPDDERFVILEGSKAKCDTVFPILHKKIVTEKEIDQNFF